MTLERHEDSGRTSAILTAVLIPTAAAAVLAVAAVLLRLLPEDTVLCPMLRMTGLRCPLCGGTHAVIELLEGNVLSAVRCNPAVVAALLPCGWMYLRLLRSCVSRPYRPYRPRISRWTAVIVVAAMVIFTVVRNTPEYKAYLI